MKKYVNGLFSSISDAELFINSLAYPSDQTEFSEEITAPAPKTEKEKTDD